MYNKEYYNGYIGENGYIQGYKKRKFLYNSYKKKVRKYLKGNVIDLGCGVGYMSLSLQEETRITSVVGIDISKDAIKIAKNNIHSEKVQFRYGCAYDIDQPDKTTDLIFALDIIEHLEKPENFLREATRVLKDRGALVISTPNPDSFGSRMKRNSKDGLIWFGDKDKTHVSIKNINDWRLIFKHANFKIIDDGTDYLWDTPYFIRLKSLQKLVFNGSHHFLARINILCSWAYGENYIAILEKQNNKND